MKVAAVKTRSVPVAGSIVKKTPMRSYKLIYLTYNNQKIQDR
ncbi:MAG TPA: hypothetical protein VLG50_00315 [Candidatus Saccharimonadales bacterium]|nr:hypothetical protein [Candidatus Saccharimonadales bacterium]